MSEPFWSDLALADLDAIGAYIAQFDAEAAARVVSAIERATLRLIDFPLSGARAPVRGVRKLSVPRVRYIVYYQPGDIVAILRVVHARRRG